MEKAVLVSVVDGLEGALKSGCSRLYFGSEFCQNRMPDREELAAAVAFAGDHGVELTLLTPPAGAHGIERLETILITLADLAPSAEVVINDYGAIHLLDEHDHRFVRVLGRVLTKQKRGPRIMNVLAGMSGPASRYFRQSCIDAPSFLSFLKENGITRVELDNPLQGLEVDLSGTGISGSLHAPYDFISSSRYCMSNGCEDTGELELFDIKPCKHECLRNSFVLRNRNMPTPLYLRGNSYFLKNDELPSNLSSMGIDRVVHETEVPF